MERNFLIVYDSEEFQLKILLQFELESESESENDIEFENENELESENENETEKCEDSGMEHLAGSVERNLQQSAMRWEAQTIDLMQAKSRNQV